MAQPVEIVASDNAATKLFPTAASVTDPVQTYGSNSYVNLLNSGSVKAGAGTFFGLTVGAAGTAITVTVYDNTAGSGTIIFGPYVLGTAGTTISMPGGGVAFAIGCYVTFSATTGTPNASFVYR